eukprot:s410_g1.t1
MKLGTLHTVSVDWCTLYLVACISSLITLLVGFIYLSWWTLASDFFDLLLSGYSGSLFAIGGYDTTSLQAYTESRALGYQLLGYERMLTLYRRIQQQSEAAAKTAHAAEMAAVSKTILCWISEEGCGGAATSLKVSAAAAGSEAAQRDLQLPVEPKVPRPKAKAANKVARSSEEVGVVEPFRSPLTSVESNASASAGALMTDASKRRFEAMEEALDRAYEDDEFSVVSETETSPPCFPNYPAGMPGTFRWGDNWEKEEIQLDYNHVDQAIPKPA